MSVQKKKSEDLRNNRVTNLNILTHWSREIAQRVVDLFPEEDVYTCAAGISPSGTVHFGNFRDVMTSLLVHKSLLNLGKNSRLIFSWDNFDRFRKVPVGIDPAFGQYIGLPLSKVPDPFGELASYACRFESEFEKSMEALGIQLDYRYQSEEYASGRYDNLIVMTLNRREEIAQALLSYMSEKGKAEKNIDPDKYIEEFYPVSVYSRFTGKDRTRVVSFDGERLLKYECLETKKQEEIDIFQERIVKLSWKVDWPMRWKVEGVVFEPGGHDHASPGGSYDVSSALARQIFDIEPPVFAGYQFIGLQGLDGKMSGSKGQAVTPATLLGIYEPELLQWLYTRKFPEQAFELAFNSEIIRQYDEFDRELKAYSEGALPPVRKENIELIFSDTNNIPVNPIPFRQVVAYGQITQWDLKKILEIVKALEANFDQQSIVNRLPKAKAWLETYNQNEIISLRESANLEYWGQMSEQGIQQIKTLSERIKNNNLSILELEEIVYGIPKDPGLSQKENSPRQRAFFKDVYNLLIGKDAGPRLSTFLWAIDRNKVLGLLSL